MNAKLTLTLALFCLLVGVPLGLALNAQTSENPQSKQENQLPPGYRISGPYSHKNLTIFLVHGDDLIHGHSFLTLQEALAQKKVIVYETKDVNELSIQNLSNQDVFV